MPSVMSCVDAKGSRHSIIMNKDASYYVAGHRGMVGGAIVRALQHQGIDNILTRTSSELDLKSQQSVNEFFAEFHPDYVFLAAAKVGGIHANDTYPADFIRDNLLIQTNVIDAAYRENCKKLLFLGSTCIYPKLAPQPIKEDYLLTGHLEPTNEWYAIAKIAGLKMCAAYRRQYGFDAISVMPTNLYGPGDNFDPKNAMVIPTLIHRIVSGEDPVTVWGDGTAIRDFAYSADIADGILLALHHGTRGSFVNLGSGIDVSISDLVSTLHDFLDFNHRFDTTKPSGYSRRVMDISRARDWFNYQPAVGLRDGLEATYSWYMEHLVDGEGRQNYFCED